MISGFFMQFIFCHRVWELGKKFTSEVRKATEYIADFSPSFPNIKYSNK